MIFTDDGIGLLSNIKGIKDIFFLDSFASGQLSLSPACLHLKRRCKEVSVTTNKADVYCTFRKPQQFTFPLFPALGFHADAGATRTMALVLVQYNFEYTAKDGRLVSIKSNESYILVSKTNEHWWNVRRDQHTRPFYVPAQYVKEVLPPTEDPAVPLESPESVDDTTPAPRETCRFSSFGLCEDVEKTHRVVDNGHNPPEASSLNSGPLRAEGSELHREEQSKSSQEPPSSPQDEVDMDFPLPPDLPLLLYDATLEASVPEFDTFPAPAGSEETLAFEQLNLNQTKEANSSAFAPLTVQVRITRANSLSVFLPLTALRNGTVLERLAGGAVLPRLKKKPSYSFTVACLSVSNPQTFNVAFLKTLYCPFSFIFILMTKR